MLYVFKCSYNGYMGFPGSTAGKESTCNTGDPSSIPGSGRSPWEGRGYPLQYSWASLMSQIVKNPPAMWETWVLFLGWEDLLGQGMAAHSSMENPWRIPMDRGTWQATVHGIARSQTQLTMHSTHRMLVTYIFTIVMSSSFFFLNLFCVIQVLLLQLSFDFRFHRISFSIFSLSVCVCL